MQLIVPHEVKISQKRDPVAVKYDVFTAIKTDALAEESSREGRNKEDRRRKTESVSKRRKSIYVAQTLK